MLRKRDPSAGGLKTRKRLLWSALKEEPARHHAVVAEQDTRDELEVGYRVGVGLKHRQIAAHTMTRQVGGR